jgi:hypothetical protein
MRLIFCLDLLCRTWLTLNITVVNNNHEKNSVAIQNYGAKDSTAVPNKGNYAAAIGFISSIITMMKT